MTGRPTAPVSIDQARGVVLAEAGRLEAETVDLVSALGRTLAADVRAVGPVPPFANSAMDGFALIAADTSTASPTAPVLLDVAGESRAGHPFVGPSLSPGAAVRISTGAALPAGADAVARIEIVEHDDRRNGISLSEPIAAWTDIRNPGEDMEAGQVVVAAGKLLGPGEIGACASAGVARPTVTKRPRVTVLATGDELLEPDEPPRPGTIRNSNGPALAAAALAAGAEVVAIRTVADARDVTEAAISAALEGSDVVLISGGVSVGQHDHVKPALAVCGVDERFWRVALRPGKPTWFGVRPGQRPCLVFGLAGNPVSALVGFELFARPALAAMLGRPWRRVEVAAVSDDPLSCTPARTEVVRLRARREDGHWRVRATGAQGSHISTSMVGVEAITLLAPERGPVAAGDRIIVQLLPGALFSEE